jgi:hypothetical protein
MWKKSYDPYEQDLFNFPDSRIKNKVLKFTARTLNTTSKLKPGLNPRTKNLTNSGKTVYLLRLKIPGRTNTILDQLFINWSKTELVTLVFIYREEGCRG